MTRDTEGVEHPTEDTQEFDVARLLAVEPTCDGMADTPSPAKDQDDQGDEDN